MMLLCACSLTRKTRTEENKTSGITPRGLDYNFHTDVRGASPKPGDMISVHITTRTRDSVVFDSRMANNGLPVTFPLKATSFNGDLSEGLAMMSAGDSTTFSILVDSIIAAGQRQQPWMRNGEKVHYTIVMAEMKTQEQVQQEKKEASEAQNKIDEQLLEDYFKQNNISAKKTKSGLYYRIITPGTGDDIKPGQTAVVNYTGKMMDGKPFDSNTDSAFNHVEPLNVVVGQGNVIAGWDEGLQLLNKGAQAQFFIPSYLAYGTQGSGAIGANSVLIFDIIILDIK